MSRRSPSPPQVVGPPPPTSGVVALCPRAHDPGSVVELPVSPVATAVVAVDNIPAFVSLSEALTLLLSTNTATASSSARRPTAAATRDDDLLDGRVAAAAVALSTAPSVYMVVLAFASVDDAAALHRRHHMKRLSTLAEERLVVRYVDAASAARTVFPYGVSSSLSSSVAKRRSLSPPNDTGAMSSSTTDVPPSCELSTDAIGGPAGISSPAATPTKQGQRRPTTSSVAAAELSRGSSPLANGKACSPSLGSGSPLPLPLRDMMAARAEGAAAVATTTTTTTPPQRGGGGNGGGCSICLESNLGQRPTVALPCGHVFDFDCFRRVEEGVCPLCRFNVAESRATCASCDAAGDLWLCLVCGDVVCGRYGRRHAVEHFEAAPSHRYFMQVGGLRVWDMGTDSFVHRVIATADGVGMVGVGGQPDHAAGGVVVPPSAFNWADLLADSDDENDGEPTGDAAAFDVAARSRIEAVAEYYERLTEELLAAQHAHFATAYDSGRAAAREGMLGTERRNRLGIAMDAAAGYGAIVDASLAALEATAKAAKAQLRAVRERHTTARATVDAQRANVVHLERIASKDPAVASTGTTTTTTTSKPSAMPAADDAQDPEVAALELKLERLYAQFA